MVLGGEPWHFSDNIMLMHPVMFREAWVDMRHDIEDKGAGPSGFPTVKGTFPGCHIIFEVLENGAQEDPHSLRLASHISDPRLLGRC